MANGREPGASNEPIYILDSDEVLETQRYSSFIDLTIDGLILHQAPPTLQQPATIKEDSPTSSNTNARSHAPKPPEITKPHSSFGRARNKPSIAEHEAGTSTFLDSPPLLVLHTNREGSITDHQQPVPENDADSELSDVMDRSVQRRLRRTNGSGSRTLDGSRYNSSTSSTTLLKEPSSGLANAGAEGTHSEGEKQRIGATQSKITVCIDPIERNHTLFSPLLSAMEEVLRSIKRKMETDHASYVNQQLGDALKRSNDLRACLPDFSDAADPFADMPPLEGDGNTTTQREHQINNVCEETSLSPAEISLVPERVPKYKHYVTITRSMLVPDNHKLYFEPYLGHNINNNEIATQRWIKKLRKLYDPQEDPQASRKREHVSRLKKYVPTMLKELELDRQSIISYIIKAGGSIDPVAFKEPMTPIELFSVGLEKTFATKIQDVFPEITEHFDALKQSQRVLEESEEVDPVKKLLQPHLMSCPICHVYICGIHGVYESDESEDEGEAEVDRGNKTYADVNLSYEGILHRQNERSARSKSVDVDPIYKGKPCGSNCFTIKGRLNNETHEWSTDERTYFQALFLGMQNETRAACIVAPLMRRPCYDVQKAVISLTSNTPELSPEKARKKERLEWYDNKRKKIRMDLDWGVKTETHLHHKNPQPTGCEHPGISCYNARDKCSCDNQKILCDKFCGCPDDCYMKFTGCNCSQGDSPCSQESLTCPCKLLNRECDPDLCHQCGAAGTVNPFTRDQDCPPDSCYNTDIQRGVRKRLLVGESSHPSNIGFGAYMAEPVKQGEFIAEYVGEIITYAECGRRSEIYNKLKVSFIFDLNDEVTIDGYRFGNLERFINHSKKNANCKPIVKLVNGEHRIGFFATKDLSAGVELFFDYGREFAGKHGLKEMGEVSKERASGSKKMNSASKGMRNVAKEMSNMLKGIGDFANEEDNPTGDEDDIMPAVVYSFPTMAR